MRSVKLKLTFILLPIFLLSGLSHSEIINHEDAIETDEIMIVGNTSNGYVLAKKCDSCTQQRIRLSPNSKAYQNGRLVPMSSVPSRSKTAITVIYDPKTNTVNSIKW